MLSVVALLIAIVGLVFTGGTLLRLRGLDQLHRLLSYDYMSFVDSQADGALGSVANDFFTGIALMLVGCVLFTRVAKTGRVAGVISAFLFVFVAVTLVYACLTSRVGTTPY